MSYVSQANLTANIPAAFILQALDDNADGQADSDAWQQVADAVSDAIDGPLGKRYTVPLANPPRFVFQAARVLASELLYQRRGFSGDANPWTKQADAIRAHLAEIAAGTQTLGASFDRQKPSASIITEPARTHSASGKLPS